MSDRPLSEEKQITDKERLDWLERQALKPDGILLHDGKKVTGRTGLGIWTPSRTLRNAIDQAMGYDSDF